MSRAVEYREVTKADASKLVPFFEAFYGQWFGEPVTTSAIDDLGLVTTYEDGWSREAAAQPDS